MVLQAQRPSNTGGEAERGAEHDSATSGSADMRRNGQAGGGGACLGWKRDSPLFYRILGNSQGGSHFPRLKNQVQAPLNVTFPFSHTWPLGFRPSPSNPPYPLSPASPRRLLHPSSPFSGFHYHRSRPWAGSLYWYWRTSLLPPLRLHSAQAVLALMLSMQSAPWNLASSWKTRFLMS